MTRQGSTIMLQTQGFLDSSAVHNPDHGAERPFFRIPRTCYLLQNMVNLLLHLSLGYVQTRHLLSVLYLVMRMRKHFPLSLFYLGTVHSPRVLILSYSSDIWKYISPGGLVRFSSLWSYLSFSHWMELQNNYNFFFAIELFYEQSLDCRNGVFQQNRNQLSTLNRVFFKQRI